MPWQLLAAALPAAAKIAGTALSKPRQEDYAPQTDYMKKYLSYIRGRSSDREVMHQAMQPALRVAGKQGRQMQRQVGYDVAKSGLGGSGIEAQMRLSAGQQTQEALATATDKAVAAQTAETARIGQQAAGITAQIGAEEARADQAFKSAESQWKRQLAGDVIGAGASLASAGITQAGQLNEAKLMAERSGYFGSAEDVQKMIDQGWTPQMLQQESARVDGQVNTLLGSGVELSDIHAELGLGAGYTGNAVAPVVQDTTETVEETVVTEGGDDIVDTAEIEKPDMEAIEKDRLAAVQAEKERYGKIKKAATGGTADGTSVELPEGFVKGDYSTYPVKEIEGVTYHVNPETGEPIMSTEIKIPKRKTGYDWYAESMRKSGREPLSKEEWGAIGNKHKEKHRKVKKPATKAETLTISRGTVKGEKVPDISIPKGKTPEEIAELLSYDKDLLKSFAPMRDYYGLSDEDWKKLKNIIESGKTLASAG